MGRRWGIGRVVAGIFAGLNLAGAGFAIAEREPWHAGAHVALAAIGAIIAWAILLRERREQRLRESMLELQVVDLEAELADVRGRLDALHGLPAHDVDASPARTR